MTNASETSQQSQSSPVNQQLLSDAWRLYCIYSNGAGAFQKRFLRLRRRILILTVIGTTLAVLDSQYRESLQFSKACNKAEALLAIRTFLSCNPVTEWIKIFLLSQKDWLQPILGFLVLITPIVITVLVAGAAKFGRGVNWILLRSSAEALKSAIYRYRTLIGIVVPAQKAVGPVEKVDDAWLAQEV
jgi:hypothetical protein